MIRLLTTDNTRTLLQSHYFGRADVALPGFAKWFEEASKEERSHATTLIEYINKRGGSVALGDINVSNNTFHF